MEKKLIALALVLNLSSCATLVNPYVKSKEGFRSSATLPEALEKADRWREAYYDAAADHSIARNVITGLVVPLVSVGAYQAITGDGTNDQIARLGVAATGLFTLSQQFTSKPRQGVYLAGMGALTCVALGAGPLVEGRVHSCSLDGQVEKISALDCAVQKHQSAVSALAGAIIASEFSESNPNLNTAKNLLSESQGLLAKGVSMQDQIAGAGRMVDQRVNQVVETVAAELRKTEPDSASILALIQQFRPLSVSVINGFKGGTSTPADTDSRGLGRTLDAPTLVEGADLTAAAAKAASTAEELRPIVARFEASAALVNGIAACSGTIKADPNFSIQPDVTEINLKVGEIYVLYVRAATGFPGVLLQSPGEKVKMSSTINPGLIVVTLNGEAATASPAILSITSPTGETRSILVKVTVAAPAPPATRGAPPALLGTSDAGPIPQQEQDALNAEIFAGNLNQKIMQLQTALGIPLTEVKAANGRIGNKTRAKLEACNAKVNNEHRNDINAKVVRAALIGDCP